MIFGIQNSNFMQLRLQSLKLFPVHDVGLNISCMKFSIVTPTYPSRFMLHFKERFILNCAQCISKTLRNLDLIHYWKVMQLKCCVNVIFHLFMGLSLFWGSNLPSTRSLKPFEVLKYKRLGDVLGEFGRAYLNLSYSIIFS